MIKRMIKHGRQLHGQVGAEHKISNLVLFPRRR